MTAVRVRPRPDRTRSVTPFRGVFQGKRVLVTGHTGFKGSWLALWLDRIGAHVTGFSLAPDQEPNLFEVAGVGSRVKSVIGDIRSLETVRKVVAEAEPDVIFHLAAQPIVRRSYAEPRYTFETNVMGTVNLLEAVRESGFTGAVVVVTSDKCYENREWPWGYRESDCLGGHDPYSASKAGAELVTASYRRSFFGRPESRVRIASARAGNVIGGGDWSESRLVPDAVRAFAAGKDLEVRSPHAIRPWQHVLEPLSGYLWLAAQLCTGEADYEGAWNFGPALSDAVSVETVIKKVQSIWPGPARYRTTRQSATTLHEAQYLQLDCSKAFRHLGWHSVLPLDEALEWTIEWYRDFYENGSAAMADRSIEQIDAYTAKARETGVKWACASLTTVGSASD